MTPADCASVSVMSRMLGLLAKGGPLLKLEGRIAALTGPLNQAPFGLIDHS